MELKKRGAKQRKKRELKEDECISEAWEGFSVSKNLIGDDIPK